MSGTIVQIAVAAPDAGPAVFGATTTPGNLIAVVQTMRGGSPPAPRMSTTTGTWTVIADGECQSDGDGTSASAQIVGTGATSYAVAAGTDHAAILAIEIAGAGISDISYVSKADQAFSTDANIGTFTAVGTNDILMMAIAYRMNGTFSISGAAYGWTTDAQGGAIAGMDHPWAWVGHRTGLGATVQARATESGGTGSDSQKWGGVAIRIRGASPVTPGVFLDFDQDGFQAGVNDNVTAYVERWHIQRGSGPEIIGGSQPGSATIWFKNTSDRFNPYNASGPMYGKLKDGLACWVGVADDGTVAGSTANGLFGGRVTDITLVPGEGTSVAPEVEMVFEDCIGWYSRLPVKLDYAEGRSHSALRLAALVEAGETRYSLADEIHTMPLSHADSDLLTVLDGINAINGTRHFCKAADLYTDWYSYVSYNRQHGLTGSGTALSASAQHADGTDGWRLTADGVINHQEATVTPVIFTPATFTVWQADVLPIEVTVARPYTVIASFDDVVQGSALNIASTGATVTSVYTPFASAGKITLTVSSGTATVTQLSVIGRLARRLEQQTATVDDLTSQAGTRGVRAGNPIGNEYLGTLESAHGIAAHVVWRYGNPQLRPTLTVENWFPTMFSLDLYDNIAFTSTQLGMSARIFEIVGITHDGHIAATDVQWHSVQYILQESRTQTNPHFFTVGTSTLAPTGTDVMAY